MNKREICKNCKYHYIEEISFDYPQSICNKDEKVGYTTEQGLSCDDFTYSKEYVKTQQQELDKYKNIVDELNTDIYSLYEDICNSDDTYSYRISIDDIINRLYEMNSKLEELKGSDN